MTWSELRQVCESALTDAGIENASRTTLDWFDDVFGLASRRGNDAVPSANLAKVDAQLERLVAGEPLAYVTGLAHFYGYELEVGEGVLIPRPETEELVRWVLEAFPKHSKLRFADVCSGSACIAVALALKRLTWKGVAVDVSPHALAVAQANVRKHDLGELLEIRQRDLLVNQVFHANERFDLIVSNPPYIPEGDWSRVDERVSNWEPHLALRVGDDNPLLFYQALCASAKQHLNTRGWLYVECNDVYAQAVAALFKAEGLQEVEIFVDMQGKERHVRGQLIDNG